MKETFQTPQPGKGTGRPERLYKRGSLVFVEGDTGAEMYVVISGKVRLLRQEGEDTVVAAVAGPGSVIGEMSLLSREPRTATAQVVEDSVVMAVNEELYASILKNIPPWISSALKSLVRRLTETIRQAGDEIVQKNIAGAIRVLLLLADTGEKREGGEVRVPLSSLREHLYVLTGLSDGEIENIFLHLILKQMIHIRKDATDQEYICIGKPDILYLYCSFLRSRARGEPFPGEQMPASLFDFAGFLLAAGKPATGGNDAGIVRMTMQQLEEEWTRQGKSTPLDAASLKALLDKGHVSKQTDGSLAFAKEKLQLLHLTGAWLPVFKEDVKI
jgi:CRP/FNR family transcriptional regulator